MYRVQRFQTGAITGAILLSSLAAATLAMPGPVQADQSIKLTQTNDRSHIKVRINEVTLVKLKEDIADALIGNPAIADITIQSSSSFVITGKSYGQTNMILLDKSGRTIFNRAIAVDDSKGNIVRIQKGAARVSYTCNPNCQPTPTLGDDAGYTKMMSDNYQNKLKAVGQALALSNQGN